LVFEGATSNAFETTLSVVDPSADRTITLPDVTGTVVTTGDTGTVTSTMVASGIAGTKISPDFGSQTITTTGIVSAALGAAATPSITFTGDTNTGIYSPGADQVAISTNASQRLLIDASGRFGVGTASPQHLCQVAGTLAVDSYNDTSKTVTLRPGFEANANGGMGLQAKDHSGAAPDGLGIYGTDGVSIMTANAGTFFERLRIDTSGRLGLGTSSPGTTLDVAGQVRSLDRMYFRRTSDNYSLAFVSRWDGTTGAPLTGTVGVNTVLGSEEASSNVIFAPSNSERMRVTWEGRVGIGTTAPGATLDVSKASNNLGLTEVARFGGTAAASNDGYKISFYQTAVGEHGYVGAYYVGGSTWNGVLNGASNFEFRTGGTERARIDSSGRFLVGTSTARSNFYNSTVSALIQSEEAGASQALYSLVSNSTTANGPALVLGKTRGTTVGSITVVQNGDCIGEISFQGMDGTEFVNGATVRGEIDGTPGANDLPTRLVFSTTADGASSPTERMRIHADGSVSIASTTNVVDATADSRFVYNKGSGFVGIQNSSGVPLYINRNTNDGTLIEFRQDNIAEGTISVSGTTVTYGGGHLARWSQLPNDEDPSDLLKGTIMSNLDEMCEWGEEDNEQLNKTKVSDVEGDPNVAGVFVSTSFSDDGPLDYLCAMTGDMIIRIAEGTPVHRGQLLMSAGDGTAKPQDDDIIRSKTIAKVTSNHVTCTYDDGSYCVPCVLMAC
jgi:hypothetical protein